MDGFASKAHPAGGSNAACGIRSSADARWIASEAGLARILDESAPNWFLLEADDQATLAKTGLGRRTWRVRTATLDVFAKAFEARGVFEQIKWRILGTPAEREWRATREAERRGVPAVRGLAVGRQRASRGRAVLLTVAADGARPLIDVWRSEIAPLRASRRRRAAQVVSSAVAKLFAIGDAKGIQHRDAHPSNILVRLSDESAEAMYVDLLGASVSRESVGANRRNIALARLDHSMRRLATRTERLRFLLAYETARAGAANPVGFADDINRANPVGSAVRIFLSSAHARALVSAIAREESRHALQLARKRDRRLHRNGPYFATLDLGDGWRATVVLKLGRRQLFPEAHVTDRTLEWWRSAFSSFLRRVDGADSHRELSSAFAGSQLQMFHASGMLERLRWTIRGSPARRTFEDCHRLRHRDVGARLALAFAERRAHGLIDAAVVVTSRL